jgi:23S rRNA (cytosine1962-C5)-methyltransferase
LPRQRLRAKLSKMSDSTFEKLTHIPPPDTRRISIHVTLNAERALRKGHPWLFERTIQKQSHNGKPGDLAVIFDKNRKFLAVGLYDPTSSIRVRVLAHRHSIPINQDFFKKTLGVAVKLRASLPENTTGYRLVNGGNDSFPGLVIDRYAKTLVVKLYTPAWFPHLSNVLAVLKNQITFEHLVLRLNRGIQKNPENLHGFKDGDTLVGRSPDKPILFQENGLWFEVDPVQGHKTGFYLDQRDNRNNLGDYSAGKRVLNLFAYTGGFSVYAARGGAHHVTSVDISSPALEAAQRNFGHNLEYPLVKACNHEVIKGDVFEIIKNLAVQARCFDIVVIDPPSFAKSQSEVPPAIDAYQRLTRLGLNVLKPGGTLVQASCSSRVTADSFFGTVLRTAQASGRPLQEIKRTLHPIDHPIGFNEGAYLKCLFAKG